MTSFHMFFFSNCPFTVLLCLRIFKWIQYIQFAYRRGCFLLAPFVCDDFGHRFFDTILCFICLTSLQVCLSLYSHTRTKIMDILKLLNLSDVVIICEICQMKWSHIRFVKCSDHMWNSSDVVIMKDSSDVKITCAICQIKRKHVRFVKWIDHMWNLSDM